ncbi:MAG: CaiB/BaiF CoA transferase family protein [Hyphomicrobiaceae bacterium]
MTGILDHVRVLDLSQFLAGPHTTLLLAGMGAEVIRVDNPQTGDSLSDSPIYYGSDGPSLERQDDSSLGIAFLKRSRGKKSITLDLKSDEGRALFLKLVARADVLVENFSVGVTKRLKIDWPSLQPVNPRLVYCSITGYGATGPDSQRRGYDVTTQAMSGLMSITGQPGTPPTKAGSPLADTIAAGFALSGILGALFHRQTASVGQFVDVSMTDVLFSLIFDEPLDCYRRLGLDYQQGNRIVRFSPLDSFQTSDGWMIICCGTDAMWRDLCRIIGRMDLAEHLEWGQMAWRVANNDAVSAVISNWTATQSTAAATQALENAGVVSSPVQSIDDLLAWPHLQAREMIQPVVHPQLGPLDGLKAAGFPIKFSHSATGYTEPAAMTGTHTREVLQAWLDVDDADLDDLTARDVI